MRRGGDAPDDLGLRLLDGQRPGRGRERAGIGAVHRSPPSSGGGTPKRRPARATRPARRQTRRRRPETLGQAERELGRAEDALARIRRDYRDGKVTADEWREFRDELEAERAAAEAARERARKRAEAVSDEDVSDEVLDRLRALRAAVLGGLDRAPDIDALRRLLRELFYSVTYAPHPFRDGVYLFLGERDPEFVGDPTLLPVRRPLDLDPATQTSEREAFSFESYPTPLFAPFPVEMGR
ncbi:MAG TPA: hypothetical protein VEF89_14680 [Solirubrobacteraceae bacterium]|nr:hypothetical protein [Solirubrobacteraceae bacterium]